MRSEMGEDSSASSCPFAIELSFSCYICNSIALIDRWVRADVGRSAAILRTARSNSTSLMQIDHHLFLTLWDKAVNNPDYDKEQWRRLCNQILEANQQFASLSSPGENRETKTDREECR
jgi:hypothetical protein